MSECFEPVVIEIPQKFSNRQPRALRENEIRMFYTVYGECFFGVFFSITDIRYMLSGLDIKAFQPAFVW